MTRLPILEKYRHLWALRPWWLWCDDDAECDYSIITHRDRLIPASDCDAIILEIEATSAPTTPAEAARLVMKLTGACPAPLLSSGVISGTQEAFPAYPVALGLQAIDTLTSDAEMFPSRAEIVGHLDVLMWQRRRALEVARAHLREHERLAGEAEGAAQK